MNKPMQVLRAAFLAGLGGLSASSGFALDLTGSYEQALRIDPDMRAAEAALLAGREKAVQGRALLRPQVALSTSLAHARQRASLDLPPALEGLIEPESSGNVHEVALQMSKPLYDAKASAEWQQLEQQTALAEISHRNAQQDLMQRVSEAYFNVLLAQESLRVTQAEKAAVQMQRDRAQARFEVGRGKITEVQEAQARYDGVLSREVSAQSTLALRQAQYRELTGVPAAGLAPLREGFAPLPPEPDSLPAWQDKGLVRNAAVLAKQGELAIAGAEIDKYRLKGRPTLDLVASYTDKGRHGGASSTLAAAHSRSALLGLQLSVPLYAGGALESREREAVASKRQAEEELAAAQRDTRLQVQDAFLAVKTGVARVGALEQSARSAQTALEATTLGRDVGNRTELDVLDAQQRLFTAQLDLAQARNDYLLGCIRLAYAAGELGIGDLHALDAYLAPGR